MKNEPLEVLVGKTQVIKSSHVSGRINFRSRKSMPNDFQPRFYFSLNNYEFPPNTKSWELCVQ